MKKYKFEVELECEDDSSFLERWDEFELLFGKFSANVKPDKNTNLVIVQNSEIEP